jgi:hypothetical protein
MQSLMTQMTGDERILDGCFRGVDGLTVDGGGVLSDTAQAVVYRLHY